MSLHPRIALFPGSFDPFTVGHEALVRRALAVFDRVVVAVGQNSDKHYMFSAERRVEMAKRFFADDERVRVVAYSDMTIDCCRREGARFLLRGLRNAADLEYERKVAAVNRALASDIETVVLLADADMENVSSTIERERLLHATNTENAC